MSEHTPGPWRVARGSQSGVYHILGADLHEVAQIWGTFAAAHSAEDAHLIAAAPDMLAALEAVAEHFEGTDAPLGALAEAAIRKSRGDV